MNIEQAKEIVMKNQEDDLIESILTVSEMAEKFKAKREIDYKMNFIKDFLKTNTDRKNMQEIADYFMEKNMYGVNNRANLNDVGRDFSAEKTLALGKFTRFYDDHTNSLLPAFLQPCQVIFHHHLVREMHCPAHSIVTTRP